MDTLSPHDITILNGRDVLRDPGVAQLRRYLPVLAVIAAPYAGMGGEQDPLNPLDPVAEWDALVGLLPEVTALHQDTDARLALVRLAPPTASRLGEALAAGGPDAFSVVHLACHGERDLLYLEDEDGSESYAVTEHVANLFRASSARLVVMDGCFSRTMADVLIRDTPVEAVIGTRRRISLDNSLTFNTRFYAGLCGGLDVRAAYRAAIRELKEKPGGQPDRYEMVLNEDLDTVTLPLPLAGERAAHPLVAENAVRVIGVPRLAGFVGRREMLTRLAADLPSAGAGVYVLRGPAGIGKTWLAAAYAARYSWRFPDGVAWLRCTAMTTIHDVIAALAQALEVSPYLPEQLRSARLLLVLDQVDAVGLPAEQNRLGSLIRALIPESCVLLTARQVAESLVGFGEGRTYTVEKFSPKDARTLAMRLAVGRDVEALDVDTIDDFLDRTLSFPWLITEGVDLIEANGVESALDQLRAFDETAAEPVGLYLRRKLEWMVAQEDRAVRLLIRVQGLPDGFELALARGLAGSGSDPHLAALLDSGLLRREGGLYDLPAGVRDLVAERFRLDKTAADQLDRAIMTYLVQSWPEDDPQPLAPVWQARLNNIRALLRRQLHPEIGISPAVMARLLSTAGPLFRLAGLAVEYLAYAQGFRELLPEGEELARLQLAMGDVAAALPDQRVESGWLFLVTLRLDDLPRPIWTEAQRAFGRHMVAVDQVEAAADSLSDALRVLLQDRPVDMRLAALLAQDWGKTLTLLGQPQDAVKRLGAAVTTFSDLHEAALVASSQYDLSAALIALDEGESAEELLRLALTTADSLPRRDLGAQIRLRLADLIAHRADQASPTGPTALAGAAGLLQEAVTDLLPGSDRAALAAAYLRLGQVQARQGEIADGTLNALRSRDLLARAGSPSEQAEVFVTLGQLLLAQGDSLSAEETLLAVLDLVPDDPALLQRAAGLLVRLHQLRARRIPYGDPQFAQETALRARASRDRLAGLALAEHTAALDVVLKRLR